MLLDLCHCLVHLALLWIRPIHSWGNPGFLLLRLPHQRWISKEWATFWIAKLTVAFGSITDEGVWSLPILLPLLHAAYIHHLLLLSHCSSDFRARGNASRTSEEDERRLAAIQRRCQQQLRRNAHCQSGIMQHRTLGWHVDSLRCNCITGNCHLKVTLVEGFFSIQFTSRAFWATKRT